MSILHSNCFHRIMPVDNYIVFYTLENEKGTVTIICVMYAGRDIENQLKNDTVIEIE